MTATSRWTREVERELDAVDRALAGQDGRPRPRRLGRADGAARRRAPGARARLERRSSTSAPPRAFAPTAAAAVAGWIAAPGRPADAACSRRRERSRRWPWSRSSCVVDAWRRAVATTRLSVGLDGRGSARRRQLGGPARRRGVERGAAPTPRATPTAPDAASQTLEQAPAGFARSADKIAPGTENRKVERDVSAQPLHPARRRPRRHRRGDLDHPLARRHRRLLAGQRDAASGATATLELTIPTRNLDAALDRLTDARQRRLAERDRRSTSPSRSSAPRIELERRRGAAPASCSRRSATRHRRRGGGARAPDRRRPRARSRGPRPHFESDRPPGPALRPQP